jgi:hypothetical protein
MLNYVGIHSYIEYLGGYDWTGDCEPCRKLKNRPKISEDDWKEWEKETQNPKAWELPSLSVIEDRMEKVEKLR